MNRYPVVGYLTAPESTAPSFGLSSWPKGEAATFLATRGSTKAALSVHGATAAAVLGTGVLLLTEPATGAATGSARA